MTKSIGIIGDSIAYGLYDEQKLGWVPRLEQQILATHSEKYVFHNISQSGDNIADATNRTIFKIPSKHFDLIIINIGINDLRRRKESHLQLDFSEGVRIMYWHKLLDTLQQTKATLIVTDLIPVIEKRYTEQASLIRYNSDVERYNEIIKNICKQRNIRFFERYSAWKNRKQEKLYQDATHPNAEGHQIIADEIFDYLEKNNLL